MHRHPESLSALADRGHTMPPYAPTYSYPGPWIDAGHAALAHCELDDLGLVRLRRWRWGRSIPGWLRPQEALKLYEMAYFADGNVLEVGSYAGLSTSILARACARSPVRKHVRSIEIDPASTAATLRTLELQGLLGWVVAETGDGGAAVRRMARGGESFSFAFIDHSHTFADVRDLCVELPGVVSRGGFVLLHDYNDARGPDPERPDFDVEAGTRAGLDGSRFQLYGIYGSSALFRRTD